MEKIVKRRVYKYRTGIVDWEGGERATWSFAYVGTCRFIVDLSNARYKHSDGQVGPGERTWEASGK